MNKITEKPISPVHEVMVSGPGNSAPPLRFDLVCGAYSHTMENFTTLWRKLPFHMLSINHVPDAASPVTMLQKDSPPITAEKTSIFFMPAHTMHRIDFGEAKSTLWIHFRILTMHDIDFLTQCDLKPFSSTEDLQEMEILLQNLINTCRNQHLESSGAWIQFYGITIAYKILKMTGFDQHSLIPQLSPRQKRLLPAIKLLETSTGRPELADLAASVHLSPSRFLAVFTEEMGRPPGKYFQDIQLTRACRLLADQRINIKECARQLGYADAFHFSREFRKMSGRSPKDYRKQLW